MTQHAKKPENPAQASSLSATMASSMASPPSQTVALPAPASASVALPAPAHSLADMTIRSKDK